ncbi:MAG: MXAN_5187 C-terminal domain-containing protein, partial [Myxococcales bacterium]
GKGPQSIGTQAPDPAVVAQEISAFEEELAALKARFEQFFLGIERINPTKDYEDFKKRLLKLKNQFHRNTAVKFRLNTLHSKFVTYERLWLKTLTDMEEGRYVRDLKKLKWKNERKKERQQKQQDAPALDPEVPAPGEPQAAAPPPPPKQKGVFSLDDLEADLPEELFDAGPPPPPRTTSQPSIPVARTTSDAAIPVARTTSQPAIPVARTTSQPAIPAARTTSQPAIPVARTTSQPAMPAVQPPPPPASAAKPPPPPPAAARPPPPPPAAAKPPPPPPAARPPPPPTQAPRAASSGGGGLSDDKISQIYNAYITAKRRCKESTDGITPDALARSLRQQVPKLMEQHGVKSVDFKVVIKDGKAILKAVPK